VKRSLGLGLLVIVLLLGLAPAQAHEAGASHHQARARAAGKYVPPARHVFVINIENKGYDATWGAGSAAPYLAKTLRRKGVLLNTYYGTAHNSQGNYIAQVSGQGPNPDMQADCQNFPEFTETSKTAPQQAVGRGCVFPKNVRSLPRQMSHAGLRWRGYMQDMVKPCQHPQVNTQDHTQQATPKHMYAARHNPFVYFHSIIDHPRYCKRHVVKLGQLRRDLRHARRTPSLSYITPDLCSDGHDAPCADGRPGGLRSVNAFMKKWVPRILRSPAYRRNGLLIITADESDGPQSDSSACCGETAVNTPQAGILGAGGGKIGALVISGRFVKPNTWSTTPYNHYSLLGSLEEIFGLTRLGYARTVPDVFGLDVYNSGWNH
jgi:hypothetical protein